MRTESDSFFNTTYPDTLLHTLPGENQEAIDLFALLSASIPSNPAPCLAFLNDPKADIRTIQPDASLADALVGLHTTMRNTIRQEGRNPLQVGYPFVQIQRPTGWHAAPLLLWPVQLEPQLHGANLWFVRRRHSHAVAFNPAIWALLHQVSGQEPKPLPVLSANPDWAEIRAILIEAGLEMPDTSLPFATLTPFSALHVSDEKETGYALQYCGVLSTFPVSPPPSQAAIPQPTALPAGRYTPGYGALDPDQSTALHLHQTNQLTAVLGGPGTGKKHLATHLAVAGLSKGARTLIIAPSLPVLQDIQAFAERIGISQLVFLFRDIPTDTPLLINALRNALQFESTLPAIELKHFTARVDKLNRIKGKLDASYQALRRPILGQERWTRLVGRYLQSNRIEGKELLGAHLMASNFELNEAEYQALLEVIPKAAQLFQEIQTLQHPLRALHHRLFLHMGQEEAQHLASHRIQAFIKRVSSLIHRYLIGITQYSDALRSTLEHTHRTAARFAENLQEHIQDYVQEFGPEWLEAPGFSLQLKVLVSSKSKRILETRAMAIQDWIQLKQIGSPLHVYGFQPRNTAIPRTGRELSEAIIAYQQDLTHWNQQLFTLVQEEVVRLNATTAHPDILDTQVLQELESAMDLLLQELNQAQLLEHPVTHQVLTLAKRQKILTDLLDTLEILRLGMRDFPMVYAWKRFWLPLPENTRHLIRALAHLKPNNWTAAFESWYLDQLLFHHQTVDLPQEALPLEAYREVWTSIQQVLNQQISQHWDNVRKQTRTGFAKILRQITLKSNANALDIAPLLTAQTPKLTDALPLVLATPDAAQELFAQAPESMFDCIILLQSEHLPLEKIAPLLRLGRRAVAFGDPFPGRSAHTNSLLTLAFDQGWTFTPLRYIHRLYPMHPLQLAQAAYIPDAGENTTGLAAAITCRTPYPEHTDTNPGEAAQLLEFMLHDIPQQADRSLPSLAIVTFTNTQRNAIAQQLLDIKRSGGPDEARIQQWERSGFGVYTLEEISGIQVDILLVSTVFGETSPPNLPLLGIYALLKCGTRKVVFFHSWSATTLERWGQESIQSGIGFLANYLLLIPYSEALDQPIRADLINRFRSLVPKTAPFPDETPFRESIADGIRPYLSSEQVLPNHTLAHLDLPIGILSQHPQQPIRGVCTDGFLATTPATDYCWELEQQERFHEYGIKCAQTWSVLWWKNADQEARRLSGQLLRRL